MLPSWSYKVNDEKMTIPAHYCDAAQIKHDTCGCSCSFQPGTYGMGQQDHHKFKIYSYKSKSR
jgi:hypothetical protein